MPMYEYRCATCQSDFDKLRRLNQSDDDVVCVYCGGQHVKRKLSTFAAFSREAGSNRSSSVAGNTGCGGGCCGGACSVSQN